MTDSVAVVIPAHNAAVWLPRTLSSLRQQTHAPRQVFVVDDGSTDDTAGVAEANGATVLRQSQGGPAAARNRGIEAARCEWIALLDADDWFAQDKLERQVGWLMEIGASAGSCDAWSVQDDTVLRRKNGGRRVPEVLSMERLLQGNPVICSTVIARRSVLLQAGCFDEDPDLIATEDYDLWLRLSRNEPIAYLDEPLAFYRLHGSSLSVNTRFLRGVDRIMDKMDRVLGEEPHFQHLVRRRRALARLEAAWDLMRGGGPRSEVRSLIRDALRQSFSWRGCRQWLRSFR